MDWLVVFLGFLQGLTEFLPVSSSGHLFLMEQVLKTDKLSLSFVLILHLATFFSVFIVFFKEIKTLLLGIQKKENLQLFLKLVVSLVPLFVIGLFFKSFVQQSFEKNTVALGFLSSGLLLSSLFFIQKKNLSLKEMSFFQAFLIGLSQSLAVLPGFSRSAWTIATGLYCGLSPRSAVYFSFLISLPAIFGSFLVDFLFSESGNEVNFEFLFSTEFFSLALCFLVTVFSGLLALLLVLKMVQSKKTLSFFFLSFAFKFICFFVFVKKENR